jgi:hypothetical protein
VIRQEINRIASQGPTKLGVAFIIGFIVSLWSANAGVKSIFDALNLVYDEPEKRSFIKLNLVSLAFTVAAILFVLIAIGCIAALPAVISSTKLQGITAMVSQIVRWPILFVIVAAGIAFVYRYGPSRVAAVALDHLGQRFCRDCLDRRFDRFFLVRSQLWQPQQDLWIARRNRHFHGLAVALDSSHPDRRGAGRRDGAPDGPGYNN